MKNAEWRVQNEFAGQGPLGNRSLILRSALSTRKSLPPVLPRHDLLTKKACGLPRGGLEMARRAVARKSQ